jgi:hypothetical protein
MDRSSKIQDYLASGAQWGQLAALRVAAAAAAEAEAIANLPCLSYGAVTNGRAAVLAVAGVASGQCGVRSGKAIGRRSIRGSGLWTLGVHSDGCPWPWGL